MIALKYLYQFTGAQVYLPMMTFDDVFKVHHITHALIYYNMDRSVWTLVDELFIYKLRLNIHIVRYQSKALL